MMRWMVVVLGILFSVSAGRAAAAEAASAHADWKAYMKANRFACPGPFERLATPRQVKLAGKDYVHSGYALKVQTRDADEQVNIGVISAVKDTSAATMRNLKQALAWFEKKEVEWVVANGDLAADEFDLGDILDALGESGLPVLLVPGNTESMGSLARLYKRRMKRFPNLIPGNWVRVVDADDVVFWTLPGYHDRAFVHQDAGCHYKEKDVRTLLTQVDKAGKRPVTLVAHGPPEGKGRQALDWAQADKNVGDPLLNRKKNKKNVPFGIFGHILEAGGAAVGQDLKTPVAPKEARARLYVNAGSLSADPWGMNDGSVSRGMALLLTLDAGKAAYRVRTFQPKSD